jgi:RNA polymerase sigma-70 factor (ECF subfamily)
MDNEFNLEAVINGESEVTRRFIAKHHPVLKRVLIKYTGDSDCDDILQEAWLKIFSKLHQFKREAGIQTWMIRIVLNCAHNHYRKQANQNNHHEPIEQTHFSSQGSWSHMLNEWHHQRPEDLASYQETINIIENTVASLPSNQKKVLILADIENFSVDKICNVTQLSVSNVRVQLHRARQRVLLAIDKHQMSK